MIFLACLNPNQVVKKEIFQIFSAIAMYSEDGYALCMNMLDAIKVKSSFNLINKSKIHPFYFSIYRGKTCSIIDLQYS